MAAWKASLGSWKERCDGLARSASPSQGGSGTQVTVVTLSRSCSTLRFSLGPWAPGILCRPTCPCPLPARSQLCVLSTCVHSIVCLQLVLEAELLAAAVALVGFLARVDALVALECALIPEAAATELTLVRVVTCGDKGLDQAPASPGPLFRGQ